MKFDIDKGRYETWYYIVRFDIVEGRYETWHHIRIYHKKIIGYAERGVRLDNT